MKHSPSLSTQGRYLVGVDLGKSGAVAWQTPTEQGVVDMPLDAGGDMDASEVSALLQRLLPAEQYGNSLVVCEAVFRPNSLVEQLGALRAVCQIGDHRLLVVPVVRWKRAILGTNSSDKALSVAEAKRLFPDLPLRRSSRCRTDSADRAEAALLCHYGGLVDARSN